MYELATKALEELADRLLKEKVSKEEAIRDLINAGILDSSGKLTKQYEMLGRVPISQWP
jgi:hypothetical protein